MNKYQEALDNLADSLAITVDDDEDISVLQQLVDKQEKYKWHDLRKNPKNLPKPNRKDNVFLICIHLNINANIYITSYYDNDGWYDEKTLNISKELDPQVIAWKEIERFEQ